MKVLTDLMGNVTETQYITGLIFCLIGFVIRRSYKVGGGVSSTTNGSPIKFDIKFFAISHFKKLGSLCISILIALVIFRFTQELFNTNFNYAIALGVGIGWDKVDDILNKLDVTQLLNTKSNSNSNPTE